MPLPILFGSIVRTHGVPVGLTLTPEGWRMYAHSHPAHAAFQGWVWPTLEAARADLQLAVETSLPRASGEA